MKTNIGSTDQLIRYFIAAGVAALLGSFPDFFVFPLSLIAVVIAVALIVTASFEVCPLYSLTGFSTKKT